MCGPFAKERALAALTLTAIAVITSCSGTNNATTTSSSASPSTSNTDTTFRSAMYGYAVTLPSGWRSTQAIYPYRWDGQSQLAIESAEVDKFMSSSTPAAWAVATRWKRNLAAFTRFSVAWNARYHGDTCPAEPASRNPVTIGGQPGVLLAYDCGILINLAATVHGGYGYWFLFRDGGVQAASDPTDRATFLGMLRSVQFPA